MTLWARGSICAGLGGSRYFPFSSSSSRIRMSYCRLTRIDSHLHVWAPPEETDRFPYADGSKVPPLAGHVDLLRKEMEGASVAGALIVQPSNHMFDHSYVTNVLKTHPREFIGCLLANPDKTGVGVSAMESLVAKDGYRCVRFNPYIWPNGQKMTNEVGQALYKRAGELGIPVGFMAFRGLLGHIEEIETLLDLYPTTKVIIDHFGFCKFNDANSTSWQRLLNLAKFHQVYVKISAFFRVSSEDYPYMDARKPLRQLVDAFGANRLMWGSDFPWVTEQCGYKNAFRILEDSDEAAGESLLTFEEMEWIMGKTIQVIFPGVWKQISL